MMVLYKIVFTNEIASALHDTVRVRPTRRIALEVSII